VKRIYFIRAASGEGPIKIGCSESPEGRRRQLSSDLKIPLVILADAPGAFEEEGSLHRQFADARVKQEWFAPTEELLALVDIVATSGELPPSPEGDRVQDMARLYVAGQTLQQIGDRFGMTRERVRQILRKNGCPSLGARPENMRRARPLTADEKAIVEMYQAGVRPSVIKARFPTLQIAAALRRAGVRAQSKGHWLRHPENDERVRTVGEMYRAGFSTAEIARSAGLPHATTVYIYLRQAGIQPERQLHLSRAKGAEVVRQYQDGANLKELAALHGVARQTIRRALVRSGVEMSRESGEQRRIAAVRRANMLRRHDASPSQQASAA
jgi:uncharacterized protein (DUF433 family)/transposase-like protein